MFSFFIQWQKKKLLDVNSDKKKDLCKKKLENRQVEISQNCEMQTYYYNKISEL